MTAVAVAIRPAAPADVEALHRLEQAVFPTDQLDRRAFRHAIRSPTILARVAVRDGALAGYVFVETRRGSKLGRLTSLAVLPDLAGQGVGRRLVEAAETAAREAGCDRMRLEVRADNARAISLYETSGYRAVATVADYYEDGAAAKRFEKSLG